MFNLESHKITDIDVEYTTTVFSAKTNYSLVEAVTEYTDKFKERLKSQINNGEFYSDSSSNDLSFDYDMDEFLPLLSYPHIAAIFIEYSDVVVDIFKECNLDEREPTYSELRDMLPLEEAVQRLISSSCHLYCYRVYTLLCDFSNKLFENNPDMPELEFNALVMSYFEKKADELMRVLWW